MVCCYLANCRCGSLYRHWMSKELMYLWKYRINLTYAIFLQKREFLDISLASQKKNWSPMSIAGQLTIFLLALSEAAFGWHRAGLVGFEMKYERRGQASPHNQDVSVKIHGSRHPPVEGGSPPGNQEVCERKVISLYRHTWAPTFFQRGGRIPQNL